MDFNFVTKRIAVGAGFQSKLEAVALASAGITHVVDCREEFDDTAICAEIGLACLWDGVEDDGKPKPDSWFDKAIYWALLAYVDPKHKLYFHCAAGINRGPSMCYAFLLSLGFSTGDAERYLRAARPQVGIAYKHDAEVWALGAALL